MWAIRGRIVPLTSDTNVAPTEDARTEDAAFTGRMWVDEATGSIIAVIRGRTAGPSGSQWVLRSSSLVAASGKPL